MSEPCMCGGCKRCLHDQGYACDDERCERCEPLREPVEMWICAGCGETFDSSRISHGRPDHAPGCDGSCRNCPVEVECGPINRILASDGTLGEDEP